MAVTKRRLTIRGFRGRQQEIEAVVDSGYTGWLTLARQRSLLPLHERETANP